MRRFPLLFVLMASLLISPTAAEAAPSAGRTHSTRAQRNERRLRVLRRASRTDATLGSRTATSMRSQLDRTTKNIDGSRLGLSERIARNGFTVNRTFSMYSTRLGPGFHRRVSSLRPGQHWIDMGAGNAFAIRDYLSFTPQAQQPQITALAAVRPNDAFESNRYRYLNGRLLSQFSAAEIGQADLITDVFGPAFYGKLDETIEQYGHLLREGGEAWISVGAPDDRTALTTINGVQLRGEIEQDARLLITPARKRMTSMRAQRLVIERWLAASSGFELIDYTDQGTIGLRRTSGPVRMAPLRLAISVSDDQNGIQRNYMFTPSHVHPDAQRHGNE